MLHAKPLSCVRQNVVMPYPKTLSFRMPRRCYAICQDVIMSCAEMLLCCMSHVCHVVRRYVVIVYAGMLSCHVPRVAKLYVNALSCCKQRR